MSKRVTQVDLKSGDRRMTTWLEEPKSKIGKLLITVGRKIKLDGDADTWWKITAVYDTKKASDIDKRGWDNNNYDVHKGLGL